MTVLAAVTHRVTSYRQVDFQAGANSLNLSRIHGRLETASRPSFIVSSRLKKQSLVTGVVIIGPRLTERTSAACPKAQGATLPSLRQPASLSTRFVPLPTAVLSVMLDGQRMRNPIRLLPSMILPITVLPVPVTSTPILFP
jgi:hypothetical protein